MSETLFGWKHCDNHFCRRCNPDFVEPMAASLALADDWVDKANAWFSGLPASDVFTSEDVTDAVGFPAGEAGANRNNAVGAWIQRLSRQKRIVRVDSVASRNPQANGAVINIWRKQ